MPQRALKGRFELPADAPEVTAHPSANIIPLRVVIPAPVYSVETLELVKAHQDIADKALEIWPKGPTEKQITTYIRQRLMQIENETPAADFTVKRSWDGSVTPMQM